MKISPKHFLSGMAIGFFLFFIFVGISETRQNDQVSVMGIQNENTPTPESDKKQTPSSSSTPTLRPTPSLTPRPTQTPILTPMPTLTPLPTPTPTVMPTVQTFDPITLVRKYAQEYGVDEQVLFAIGQCESGFNTTSANGPYAGIYQFHYLSWAAIRGSMGLDSNPDLRFNPEESIKTAAFKISKDGVGAWPACSNRL